MTVKWYSYNFSNEQILQGQQTLFLRFRNTTHKVSSGKVIYIYVIPEILNVDPNSSEYDEYQGHIFLNATDIYEINKIFKNSNNLNSQFIVSSTNNLSNPTYNGIRVFSILGTANNFSSGLSLDEFGLRFPITDQIKLGSFGGPRFWSQIPLNNGQGTKINYRIDFSGKKNLVAKLTFLLTTIPPLNNDWKDYPALYTTPPTSTPKIGDVYFDASTNLWKYYDNTNTWQTFPSPFDTQGPWMGIKNLHELGFFKPDNTWNGPWIDYQEIYLFCYTKNTFKPSRETQYWIDKKTFENPIYDTQTSYMLLRTNPKLSGNVKMVVDSQGSIYLESIDANQELANSKFKKNKISPRGSYAADLKKYFSSVTPEVMFQVAQRDESYLNTHREFSQQYDFFYGYGVSQLNSKYYDEEFCIFAPLWVRKKLPDFFVIFKVEGPVNLKSYTNASKEEILQDLVSYAKILKTYDLRRGSNLGQYLRNLVEDQRFVEQPLHITYEKDILSTWHGISYREGILSAKGEFLYDFFRTDKAINDFEEFITLGFQRNGIICANLLNLEFLFNDDEAQDYEINRYFGLYVNEIELAKFELYPDAFFKLNQQTPLPQKNVDAEAYSLRPFIQKNPEGIILPIDYFHGNGPIGQPENQGRVKGKLPPIDSVNDKFRFFYVRDRDDNIFRIKDLQEYQYGNLGDPNFIRFTGLKLYNTSLDISKFAGITKIKAQLEAQLLPQGHAQIVVEIDDALNQGYSFVPGEIIEIEWIDINQNRQLWRMIANPTGLQPGDFWDFPVYDTHEFLYVNTFNPEGQPEIVAQALAGCINHFDNKIFKAYAENQKIYIRADIAGDAGNGMIFRRKFQKSSVIRNLKFYGFDPLYTPKFEVLTSNINTNTTGSFKIEELENNGTYNEYRLEVINFLQNSSQHFVTLEIRKNGGLIAIHSWDLSNPSNIIAFSNAYIKITPILVSGSSYIYTIGDTWIFRPDTNMIQQRFVGGSQRNRNRALIKSSDALNISSDYWYQSQKAKYSRLQTWEIQGKKIFALPNLEKPLIQNGKILGYQDLHEKSIIQLDDSNFEFYLTQEKRIVAFDAFEPRIGILSFLHVKDFDFDWIFSDYSYTPNPEVFEYFERYRLNKNEEKEIPLFSSYKLIKGSIQLQGYNSQTQSWDLLASFDANTNPNFNTYLPAYLYNPTSDSKTIRTSLGPNSNETNYFFRNYLPLLNVENYTRIKVVCLSLDCEIVKNEYEIDKDLKAFKGFLGLSDFFSQEDEIELENLIEANEIERYFYNQLRSEYDRLRENFNKDYAVKSRVVPYINKWVQKGRDCRDNPYRLNTSLAFGVTGFSPDTQIKDKDPSLHTHEFYYLDEIPQGYPEDLLENSRSYFFQNISDKLVNYQGQMQSWYSLFKENTQDWFSKYFTIGYPTEIDSHGSKIRKKTEERYVFLDYVEGVNQVQGLFRGAKFCVMEIDPTTGSVIRDSLKYQGYKFSSILRILPLPFDTNQKSSTIEFIANETYKTLLMITTLYINDYRINSNRYGYVFLYAANSALRNTDVYNSDYLNSLLNQNTSSSYIESSMHRHYQGFAGSLILDYADIKLNGVFNFVGISPGNNPRKVKVVSNTGEDFNPIEEILSITGDDYDKEKIFNPSSTTFSNYYLEVLERGEFSEISQYHPNSLKKVIVNHQSQEGYTIDTSSAEVVFKASISPPPTYYTSGLTTSFSFWPTYQIHGVIPNDSIDENTQAWYLSGGEDYLKRRLEEVSFASLFERVNNDIDISYFSVNASGIQPGYFKFRFIDFDRIQKQNRLEIIEDTDKPNEYLETPIIGFNIQDSTEDFEDLQTPDNFQKTLKKKTSNIVNEVVFRHRGRFEPKTRKIFNYWLREDEIMTQHYATDFLLANTRWGVEYKYFGEIQNLFYSKVAKQEILKISSTSKYKSLYPLINEIAIDKKDFFVLSSNWDDKYYNFYTDLTTYISQEGTLELQENKSFLSSKVMQVPKRFEIHVFNSSEVKYQILNPLLATDVAPLKIEIDKKNSVLEDSSKAKLLITIDAASRLLREMLETNAAYEFKKLKLSGFTRFANLTFDELNEEVKTYLIKNILALYKVSDVSLYIKQPANISTDPILRIDLDKNMKHINHYKVSKNTKVNQISDFIFTIEEELDTKNYKAYSISITLQRI